MLSFVIASLSVSPVCDSTKQMYKDSACCGGDGLSYCSSTRIDLSTLESKIDTLLATTLL
jgi:hypothetical protein